MAGRGPAPAENRRRRNVPARGEWQPAPGSGWRHGTVPPAPEGLMPASVAVWDSWFASWWAANWTPEYVPQITVAIKLYDSVQRGNLKDATELRQAMDGIGATFKGQQDRRWAAPKAPVVQPAATPETKPSRYEHLRSVAG